MPPDFSPSSRPENEAGTFHELLSTAEGWLRDQGMLRIRGRLTFPSTRSAGFVTVTHLPLISDGPLPPYYPARLTAEGYQGVKDLLAYRLPTHFTPEFMKAVFEQSRWLCTGRAAAQDQLNEDLEIIEDIFEDAWSTNWGFIPFTEDEVRHLGYNLRLLVDDDAVQIAEVDGVPAAMIVAFPNLNEVIRDLQGRLLPFGWLKLLWRLKVKSPKTARVVLMGVRKRFQRSALGAALGFPYRCRARCQSKRSSEVELSGLNITCRCGIYSRWSGLAYKRYRIYEKAFR